MEGSPAIPSPGKPPRALLHIHPSQTHVKGLLKCPTACKFTWITSPLLTYQKTKSDEVDYKGAIKKLSFPSEAASKAETVNDLSFPEKDTKTSTAGTSSPWFSFKTTQGKAQLTSSSQDTFALSTLNIGMQDLKTAFKDPNTSMWYKDLSPSSREDYNITQWSDAGNRQILPENKYWLALCWHYLLQKLLTYQQHRRSVTMWSPNSSPKCYYWADFPNSGGCTTGRKWSSTEEGKLCHLLTMASCHRPIISVAKCWAKCGLVSYSGGQRDLRNTPLTLPFSANVKSVSLTPLASTHGSPWIISTSVSQQQ